MMRTRRGTDTVRLEKAAGQKKEIVMLSLSRRPGESILIGDEISVSIDSVKGNRVRISILAPRQIPIRRSELLLGDVRIKSTSDQSRVNEDAFSEIVGAS